MIQAVERTSTAPRNPRPFVSVACPESRLLANAQNDTGGGTVI